VAKAAVVLEIVLSIGALGGGLVLMIAPRGEIMPLPLSALAGSPFDTYFVPVSIRWLLGAVGIGGLQTITSRGLVREARGADSSEEPRNAAKFARFDF
jgi:hypothetical protein